MDELCARARVTRVIMLSWGLAPRIEQERDVALSGFGPRKICWEEHARCMSYQRLKSASGYSYAIMAKTKAGNGRLDSELQWAQITWVEVFPKERMDAVRRRLGPKSREWFDCGP
jgi:hypothetical protein